jgi:gamma-glutamylcyclotransferase (GGCT)/AIG2-like uncharacterized protein YtfP
MENFLFTYGTLRLNFEHPMAKALADASELYGLGYIKNAKLYRVDWYPALILSDDAEDIVIGDIFKIHDSSIIKQLDEYEGVKSDDTFSEYRREKVKVYMDSKEIYCWIYIYNVKLSDNAVRIDSGDFLNP